MFESYIFFTIVFIIVALGALTISVLSYEGRYEFEKKCIQNSLVGLILAPLWPLVLFIIFTAGPVYVIIRTFKILTDRV